MEDTEDKKAAFLIDSSVLQHMFEGKNEGKAGEVLKLIKEMKDSGASIKVATPMSSFLRAIFLADPKVTINDIQKTLSVLEIIPTTADFKDKEAVTKDVMKIANLMSGEPVGDTMTPEEKELWDKEKNQK